MRNSLRRGSSRSEEVLALFESGAESTAVCIPLPIGDRPVGAILIHRLLVQKDALTRKDHQLFALLGEHAASTLVAAPLHEHSKQKLGLFRGLCEFLID